MSLGRRDRVVITGCLVLAIALAWAYLVHLDRQMSAAMAYDREMAAMGMAMAMDKPWGLPTSSSRSRCGR